MKNNDHEGFTWCTKYHQTDKSKNSDRLSVSIKIEDNIIMVL